MSLRGQENYNISNMKAGNVSSNNDTDTDVDNDDYSAAPMYEDVDSYYEAASNQIVHQLGLCGINFLCVDFDDTLVSVCTMTRAKNSKKSDLGTYNTLAGHGIRRTMSLQVDIFDPHDVYTKVRPLFKLLIPKCGPAGIHVAIVTLNPDVKHIKKVLELAFGLDLARRIHVVGNDNTWEYMGSVRF
jgi:hypothetical protein